MHARLERRPLALLDDPLVDLRLGVLVGLLDQRRVDPAVGDQPLQRDAGDLAPYPVEARKDHGRRGLVDDHVDAGELLERPDVAAVAADDPALHLVARQLDQASRAVAGVAGRQPLHRDREDVARAALGLVLGLGLDLLQPQPGLMAGLLLDVGEQQLLGLRGAQPRDPLQLAPLDPLGALQLLGLLREVALAVLERLQPPLEVGALDLQRLRLPQGPLLHPRDLGPARLELIRGRGQRGPRAPRGRSSVAGLAAVATVATARVSPSLTSPFRAGSFACRQGTAVRPTGPRPAAPETLVSAMRASATAAGRLRSGAKPPAVESSLRVPAFRGIKA